MCTQPNMTPVLKTRDHEIHGQVRRQCDNVSHRKKMALLRLKKGACNRVSQKETTLLVCWSQASSLHKYQTIDFCCLPPSVWHFFYIYLSKPLYHQDRHGGAHL